MTSQLKCPHCGKPLALVAAQEKETTPAAPAKPTYLPARDLEAALGDHLQIIDVIDTEGKLVVAPVNGAYIPTDQWRTIMKIVKAHGGTWISGASEERHWEVPK